MLPLLFLYAHNMNEVSASQVLKLMLLLVPCVLLLWILLSLLLRNTLKAGMATTIFVILFFSYGRFYDLVVKWDSTVFRHAYLLPAALLLWSYSVYFIKIVKIDFGSTTKILNVVSVTLISVNLTSIALHEIRKADLQPQTIAVAAADLSKSDTMPDIYYIILDEYAHPDTMLEFYDYDNSDFVDELADRGFYVASNSVVTYPTTWKSIASSLNMEYLPSTESKEFYYQKIMDSTVVDILRSIGYTYICFGSLGGSEACKVNADVYYNFHESSGGNVVVGAFSRTLWNTTMARPFHDHLNGNIYAGQYRSATIAALEGLKSMPYVEGPKFVFAHILSPHMPFVFGSDGDYVLPENWYDTEQPQLYQDQYTFISDQISAVVTELLSESSSDPIIILQSDHGPRVGGVGAGCVGMDGEQWRKVLNAYYLPGDGEADLYDSISPLNSFRVIFNHYFGAHYGLLDDNETL
jgi:Sulfatase